MRTYIKLDYIDHLKLIGTDRKTKKDVEYISL